MSKKRKRLGPTERLILTVAIPRLLPILDRLNEQLDNPLSKEVLRKLVRTPGSEGLAYLLGLLPQDRKRILIDYPLEAESRMKLIDLLRKMGDRNDPSSPAGFFLKAFPVASKPKRVRDDSSKFPGTNKVPERKIIPPGSRIVYSPNHLFVGRDKDLESIADHFQVQNEKEIVAYKNEKKYQNGDMHPLKKAIIGMGGVGKTQLANEFVHRYGHRFPGGVFWINFSDPTSVGNEVVECGMSMGVVSPGMPFQDAVKTTLQAWDDEISRLLIFDNCEEEALFEEWCPKTGWCHILMTSRRRQWKSGLGISVLSLDNMDQNEGLLLLLNLCSRLEKADPMLPEIIGRLGGLPLSLHLAGSFLRSYPSVSTAEFLDQLEQGIKHPALEGCGVDHSPTDHFVNVFRAFEISFEKLDTEDSHDGFARDLLARASCFMPGEPIPRELLWETLEIDNDLDKEDGARRLVSLGFLESLNEKNFRLHWLVADYVKKLLPTEAALEDVESTLLNQAERLNHQGDPRLLALWQGHLKWVTDHATINQQRRGSLCSALGFFS